MTNPLSIEDQSPGAQVGSAWLSLRKRSKRMQMSDSRERKWPASLAAATLGLCASIWSCSSVADEIQRGYYDGPGIYPNRDYINTHFTERIDPYNGSVHFHHVDLFLPGNGGFDLKLIRSYDSSSVRPLRPLPDYSQTGVGWDINFGRVVTSNQPNAVCQDFNSSTTVDNPVLIAPDGAREELYYPGGSSSASDNALLTARRWRLTCPRGMAGVSVFSPDGVRYDLTHLVYGTGEFSGSMIWLTTKITDRNGNYAEVKYFAPNNPLVDTVATNDGRSLTFKYLNSVYGDTRLYPNPIVRVIASTGQSVTYRYRDATFFQLRGKLLTDVELDDGTAWEYAYSKVASSPDSSLYGNFLVSSVTTPRGGEISYRYGFVDFYSTGVSGVPANAVSAVTSKATSDGGRWTYRYSPSRTVGSYDTTTETSPAGTTTYRHYGYKSVNEGSMWKVGLLHSKTIDSSQTESYEWSGQLISTATLERPSVYGTKKDLNATNLPLMTKRTIVRDGARYVTEYSSFDDYGNPRRVLETGPGGGRRTTTVSYYVDTGKWILHQPQDESFLGGSIKRSFDANGNLTSISKDGVVTKYTYDADGNVASKTLPRGLVHNYTSYKRGIPQTEYLPEGVTIRRVVDDAGNVVSETNGDGRRTDFEYDVMNRVTRIRPPVGNPVYISYEPTRKTASRGSLTETTLYDGFERPVSVTLGGISRSFRYDPLGRRIFESNPGATVGTSFDYDILDRVTRISNQDGSSSVISYGAGTKTVRDERNRATSYSYLSYGDPSQQYLMGISAPETSANVTIERNARDLVTSVTQAGLRRTFGYNSNYFLTSETNPETGTTTYGRDAAGNMTSRSVGSSGTTSYSYDNQNRLETVTYPGSTPKRSYTYSKTHKMLTARSSGGDRSFDYDANGNLIGETLDVDGRSFDAQYTYNANDQLSSIRYPRSGRVVNYYPDVLGRPTKVSGYVDSVSYWPSGMISEIKYANSTVTRYGQNLRMWPSTFDVKLGTNTYLNSSYTYDGAGNLTKIADTVDSSYNRTLGYDGINRLTSFSGPWGTGSVAYDGTGNIKTQMLGSWSLSYAYSGNRLSSVSGSLDRSYGYDAYGNIVSAGLDAYTYDGVPNLRCVNCADAENKIEYTYDGTNHRSSVLKGGVKTYEMYDAKGLQLIEFTPSRSNRLVEYIYLGGKRIAQRVSP